jgi:hypothetical protein
MPSLKYSVAEVRVISAAARQGVRELVQEMAAKLAKMKLES